MMDVAPVYVVELTRILLEFQKVGYLCDTVIVVEDGQLKAHSVVLAAASPLFRDALKVDTSPMEHTVIMPGIQLSLAEIILEYMYTGNFEVEGQTVDSEQMNKLQQAIQEFGINLHLVTEEKCVFFSVMGKILFITWHLYFKNTRQYFILYLQDTFKHIFTLYFKILLSDDRKDTFKKIFLPKYCNRGTIKHETIIVCVVFLILYVPSRAALSIWWALRTPPCRGPNPSLDRRVRWIPSHMFKCIVVNAAYR